MLGRPESLQTLMEDMRHAASKPSTFASSFIPVFALPVGDFLQLQSPEEAAALALQDEIIADAAEQQHACEIGTKRSLGDRGGHRETSKFKESAAKWGSPAQSPVKERAAGSGRARRVVPW